MTINKRMISPPFLYRLDLYEPFYLFIIIQINKFVVSVSYVKITQVFTKIMHSLYEVKTTNNQFKIFVSLSVCLFRLICKAA